MKKITILGLVLLGLGFYSLVSASVSPFYKECMQRGYQVEDINSNTDGIARCIFPDNSKCAIEEFNNGSCGQKFMVQNYCVKKGTMVWDESKCCQGLKPYLPTGMSGQESCQPAIKSYLPYLCLIGGLIIGLSVYFLVNKKRIKI